MTVIERCPLKRNADGEYENEHYFVARREEENPDINSRGMAVHPLTGHEYVPAPIYSWFVWEKASGDFHDAFPTLREARRIAEYSRPTRAGGR